MKVVYDGPHSGVEIDNVGIVAVCGEPVTVPDALGARLCEQDTWSEVKPAKAQAATKDKE